MSAGDGPLTVLPNLRGCVDANGYLILSGGTSSGSNSPLTNLWNLRGCTDSSGHLLIATK